MKSKDQATILVNRLGRGELTVYDIAKAMIEFDIPIVVLLNAMWDYKREERKT